MPLQTALSNPPWCQGAVATGKIDDVDGCNFKTSRVVRGPAAASLLTGRCVSAQVGTIVWHVAAHEIGHAIYGLDGVKDTIRVSTKTLLEEPRAELTALHTMTLLPPRRPAD